MFRDTTKRIYCCISKFCLASRKASYRRNKVQSGGLEPWVTRLNNMPYKDPLKAKEFQRKRYLKHQEFKKQYMKEWRLKNKHLYNSDKVKNKLLLTTYKISLKGI
jgi:hypothetical protein